MRLICVFRLMGAAQNDATEDNAPLNAEQKNTQTRTNGRTDGQTETDTETGMLSEIHLWSVVQQKRSILQHRISHPVSQ